MNWTTFADVLFGYVFYYPFFMAYLWMAGGIAFFLQFERPRHREERPPALPKWPLVSILVSCYNEQAMVREMIAQLLKLRYPDYEIIAINDGSIDLTGPILDELALTDPRLRVIHQQENQGKAVGLNTGVMLARGEFIMCIDADALLDREALTWMLRHFLESENVGAVTGNPRIRTRSSLIGRMQVGEFSSTIGLIKRTQHLWGTLFTVSGVVAMFRRKALLDAGFWSPNMLTEDIDISWKIQIAGWRIRYEPRASVWIHMPERLNGLYKQRLRWAMGGVQTLRKFTGALFSRKQWRMWPIYWEYTASVVWAYAMVAVLVLSVLKYFVPLPEPLRVSAFPEWRGILLGITCMLQILTGLLIDRRHDRSLMRYYLWTVWYPVAFWMIILVTTFVAVPRVLLRAHGKRATWNTSDRGFNHAKPK